MSLCLLYVCDVRYKCLLSGKGGVGYVDRGQAGKEGGMGTGKGKREGIGRIGVCGGYDGVEVHRDGGK